MQGEEKSRLRIIRQTVKAQQKEMIPRVKKVRRKRKGAEKQMNDGNKANIKRNKQKNSV